MDNEVTMANGNAALCTCVARALKTVENVAPECTGGKLAMRY